MFAQLTIFFHQQVNTGSYRVRVVLDDGTGRDKSIDRIADDDSPVALLNEVCQEHGYEAISLAVVDSSTVEQTYVYLLKKADSEG